MKRIALIVIRVIWYLPYWWGYKVNKFKNTKKYSLEERYAFVYSVVPKIIKKGRIELKCYGLENLPEKSGYFVAPNHQGLFDMLALYSTCPNPISVVIKKEAANWILVKQVLGATRSLSMDRNDMKDQAKVILEVAKRVKGGENFVIFAEGHRSRKENQILEFKSGTFKAATKAKCPIVPVALINSFRPFDINSLKRENVEIHYMEPIYPDQYIGMNTTEIAHLVHDRIQEEINKNLRENALTS